MANKAISTLAVGSSVYLNVGGVRKEFLVVHQGLPSSLYDASCNGTWLLMKDCYEKRQWNSWNSNVYETSTINTYLNGTFFGLFDANIQEIIKQVKIPYRNGGGNGSDKSGSDGLSCKVFLLSAPEVGLSSQSYVPNDGNKLDYFIDGMTSDAIARRNAYLGDVYVIWYLRSPWTMQTAYVWAVNTTGAGGPNASNSNGIRPCIILPSDTLVDDSGNVVTVDLTAHKTLVNGTAYTVKGGKCLVNGTVYSIKKGRTLIGGTGYDVTFEEPASKSWYLNEGLSGTVDATVIFKSSDGTSYVRIKYGFNGNLGFYTLQYFSTASETDPLWVYAQNNGQNRWRDTAKRTITFDDPPTGDLLAWLEQNATPQ